MLRRRRSYCPEKVVKCDFDENKTKKLKMSPIPEQPNRKRARSPESSNSILKPSEIVQFQKAIASSSTIVTQQPSANEDSSSGTANVMDPVSSMGLNSIWDGVLTWMKSAMDYVGQETTDPSLPSPPKKRPLQDSNQKGTKNRRLTLGPSGLRQQTARMNQTNSIMNRGISPLVSSSSSIPSNPPKQDTTSNSKLCTTNSLLASAKRFESTTNKGLSLLLESPCPSSTTHRSITTSMRQSTTRQSDNTTELRRSPRLASVNKSSVPPPPPPPPPPPLPPSVPTPPPPPPTVRDGRTTPIATRRNCTLQQMQNRLRTRMMKKTDVKTPVSGKTLCFKEQQWAEIQARKRRIPVPEFLDLAKTEQTKLQETLQQLNDRVPNSLEELSLVVDRLQEASLWFPGGYREIKEDFPLYRSLEKNIETMNECVQIQRDMNSTVNSSSLDQRDFVDLQTYLELLKDEFYQKHKHWGFVLNNRAQPWKDIGLPVDDQLLESGEHYLSRLVTKFVCLTKEEYRKVETNNAFSLKTTRITKLKERFKEGLLLLTELVHSSFTSRCSFCNTKEDSTFCGCHCINGILEHAVCVGCDYVNLCVKEYNGFMHSAGRQVVCEHFESILKIISLLKSLVRKSNSTNLIGSSGLINALPMSEELSSILYNSCVLIIQHISKFSQSIMVDAPNNTNSREILLWMMFGCKYVNQILEVLGNESTNEKGVQSLLDQLQDMEKLLPE